MKHLRNMCLCTQECPEIITVPFCVLLNFARLSALYPPSDAFHCPHAHCLHERHHHPKTTLDHNGSSIHGFGGAVAVNKSMQCSKLLVCGLNCSRDHLSVKSVKSEDVHNTNRVIGVSRMLRTAKF